MRVARMWLLVTMMVGLALVGALWQPVSLLQVVTRDGDALACRQIGQDATATLVFTHSMYGGEVRETWRVDGGALERVRIVTDNAAAAEYYATDGETRPVADGYEVLAPPLHLDALPFRIDRIGRHRLRIGGDEIRLSALIEGSAGATMSAIRVPLIARIVDPDAGCGE